MRFSRSHVLKPVSRFLTGACIEDVNHEIYGGLYSQMIFGESFQEPSAQPIDGFILGVNNAAAGADRIDGLEVSLDPGAKSLRVARHHQDYQLLVDAPCEIATKQWIKLRVFCHDGTTDFTINDADWHRYDFTLRPDRTDASGRFDIALNSPGSVDLGYVFLEPGPWGTFKGLPVRADVARGLIDQGVTAMRYGGSMVNNDGYRWKKMIGDRDHRPPYHGLWYACSTNGWSIPDFLNFCEAANFLPVVDVNINESPADVIDFLEYANGPAESPWGAKRASDGHPQPHHLTHVELGNEERVDEKYSKKFEALAEAIWAKVQR